MNRESIVSEVLARVQSVLPTATDVQLLPSPRTRLELKMAIAGHEHRFWLTRVDRSWVLDEHRVNGVPQLRVFSGTLPRFELLLEAAVGTNHRRPQIEVKELRCPQDPRRLFGKLIVQRGPLDSASNLLEFACPQCKRSTGYVTMHVFDMDGELVKTQQNEVWHKREVGPWHEKPRKLQQLSFNQGT